MALWLGSCLIVLCSLKVTGAIHLQQEPNRYGALASAIDGRDPDWYGELPSKSANFQTNRIKGMLLKIDNDVRHERDETEGRGFWAKSVEPMVDFLKNLKNNYGDINDAWNDLTGGVTEAHICDPREVAKTGMTEIMFYDADITSQLPGEQPDKCVERSEFMAYVITSYDIVSIASKKGSLLAPHDVDDKDYWQCWLLTEKPYEQESHEICHLNGDPKEPNKLKAMFYSLGMGGKLERGSRERLPFGPHVSRPKLLSNYVDILLKANRGDLKEKTEFAASHVFQMVREISPFLDSLTDTFTSGDLAFLSLAAGNQEISPKNLKITEALFRWADTDSSGGLSHTEWKAFLLGCEEISSAALIYEDSTGDKVSTPSLRPKLHYIKYWFCWMPMEAQKMAMQAEC